jgi:hypothetical protein
MTQELAEQKLNNEPPLVYFIRGMVVEDGSFKLDAAAAHSREDISREAKKFVKYNLYRLEIDKNQNL